MTRSSDNIASILIEPDTKFYKAEFARRMEKQKTFFERKEKGDIITLINMRYRGFSHSSVFFNNLLANTDVEDLIDDDKMREMISNYIGHQRGSFFGFYGITDDALPALTDMFFHMGVITSAFTGIKPVFRNQTAFAKTDLDWEEIKKLRFDGNNPWIRFSHLMHKYYWKFWDGDYLVGGFWHSTPLDLAWAIRGSDIFMEMYDRPDDVKWLLDWCTDSIIKLEEVVNSDIERTEGYKGILCTLVPDGAVFVNGDPIDLITRDQAREFEVPYTSRLFTALNGGFYHHHSLGLHQEDIIAGIEDMSVHNINNDFPITPDMAEQIIDNSKIQENVIQASLKTPVMLDVVNYRYIDKLIPIIKQGRFILSIVCDDYEDTRECLKKIENINNLK